MPNIPIIQLKSGRERSVLRKHPWIFSGAILSSDSEIEPGQTVKVLSAGKEFLGWGSYSPASQIRVRILSFTEDQPIDQALFHRKIGDAIAHRRNLPGNGSDEAQRLIHAETDGLPGIIVDRYADLVVVQLLTAGAYYWRDDVLQEIDRQLNPTCLLEKSDADVLELEGLQPRIEIVKGDPSSCQDIRISEHGLAYRIQAMEGQKTGFYLDQRDNRLFLRNFTREKKVLDCFCYSGGFSLNALKGGADSVISVDSSDQALDLLRANLVLNELGEDRISLAQANVFEYLRLLRDKNEHFDCIILDPPKFAPTSAQVEKASRAYKDINLLALKLLNPGGMLFSFSCSGGVSMEVFRKIVSEAAADAGKELEVIKFMHQASDHPVLTSFPEGEYLKGLAGIVV